jgi:hypothetical protein
VAEHLLELELFYRLGSFLIFGIQLILGSVAGLVKFIENFEVFDLLIYAVVSVCPDFLGADVLENRFCLFGIVPEIVLM